MKKLVLKYDNDRYTAMQVYDNLRNKKLKDLHLSYIAGWIIIKGNIELTTLTDDIVEFKINDKEFNISRKNLDGIEFE